MTQAALQREARALGASTGTFNEDLHAAFTALGVAEGQLNGRAISYTGNTFGALQQLLTQGFGSLSLNFAEGPWDPRITFTRATTATYTNSAGQIASAAINAPRIDYDPVTLACKGLLIEEARTNLLLNSDTLSTQSVTVAAVAHTLTFYGTGTVTLSGVSTAGPLVGTGAYPNRVSLTFTPTAGSLTLTVSGSVTSAQLEAGSFASSYIPTVASQVTRAADVAVMTGTNFSSWYNQAEGTFVAEFSRSGNAASGRVFAAHNGTSDEQIRLTLGVSINIRPDFQVIDGGVPVANVLGAAEVATGATARVASAYRVNDVNAAVKGILGTNVNTVSMPTVTTLNIGTNEVGTASSNGHIRRLTYYPVRLPNATLQALSA